MTSSKEAFGAGSASARARRAKAALTQTPSCAQNRSQAVSRDVSGNVKASTRPVSSSSIHVSRDVLRTVQQQQLIRISELELSLSINMAELQKLRALVARVEGGTCEAYQPAPPVAPNAPAVTAQGASGPMPVTRTASVPSNSSVSSGQTGEVNVDSVPSPLAQQQTASSHLSPARKTNKRAAPAGVLPLKLVPDGNDLPLMVSRDNKPKLLVHGKPHCASGNGEDHPSPMPSMSPVSVASRDRSQGIKAVPESPAFSSVGSTASSRPCKRVKKASNTASASAAAEGQTRYWNRAEHERFLLGLQIHGLKSYTAIAETVGTRTAQQVRTHAQKYEMKLEREAHRRGVKAESLMAQYPTLSLSESAGRTSINSNGDVAVTALPTCAESRQPQRQPQPQQQQQQPRPQPQPQQDHPKHAAMELLYGTQTSSSDTWDGGDCARSPVTGTMLPPVMESVELAGSHGEPDICHGAVDAEYDFILMSDETDQLFSMDDDYEQSTDSGSLADEENKAGLEYVTELPLSVPYVLENPDFNSLFVAH